MSGKKIETKAEEVTTQEELKADEIKTQEAEAQEKVKLKVLIPFTDKYTEKEYKLNRLISVDDNRSKELF